MFAGDADDPPSLRATDASTAVAAVLIYPLATFHVPPPWGFFALRWLERNKFL